MHSGVLGRLRTDDGAGLQGVPLLWMLPVVAASAGGFAYLMRLFEDELLRDMVGRNLQ